MLRFCTGVISILCVLTFVSNCAQEPVQKSNDSLNDGLIATILGGKSHGKYESLINLFDELPPRYDCEEGAPATSAISYICRLNPTPFQAVLPGSNTEYLTNLFNEQTPRNVCNYGSPFTRTTSDDCEMDPKLFQAVTTGGSIDNLKKLREAETLGPGKHPAPALFAMVQSNFAYSVAAGTLEDHESLEELRLVLPMYYSFIQVVTVSEESEAVIRDPNYLSGKKVYLGKLGSANFKHGKAFLEYLPVASSIIFKCFDESISQLTDCDATRETVNVDGESTQKAKLLFTARMPDELLACGEIDAYVVSGELKPPEVIECPGDHKTKQRIQMSIPADIIKMVVAEKPFYQMLSAPDRLTRTAATDDQSKAQNGQIRTWSIPAVTTFLVTTSESDQDVVKRVTKTLLNDWSRLKTLADLRLKIDLIDPDYSLRRQPVELHQGAEAALRDELGITIFGGSSTGAYSALVKLFNTHRANQPISACSDMFDDIEKTENCDQPDLPKFTHVLGGSIENLQKLGIGAASIDPIVHNGRERCLQPGVSRQLYEGPASILRYLKRSVLRHLKSEPDTINVSSPFALVQNFHLYRAGKGTLPNETGKCYEPFDEVGTVLPMYNSYIQVVTGVRIQLDKDSKEIGAASTLAATNNSHRMSIGDLANKNVYLGKKNSVNREYGREFLSRQPQLQGDQKPKYLCLQNKAGDPEETPKLVACFADENSNITDIELTEEMKEDVLLSCGLIDAYVISGTLKPLELIPSISQAEENNEARFPNKNCETYNKQNGPMVRVQLAIPELILDAVANTRELSYYQKLPAPETLGDLPAGLSREIASLIRTPENEVSEERLRGQIREALRTFTFSQPMPAVTAYLVATETTDDELVEAVSLWLLREWTSLTLLAEADPSLGFKLPPVQENILRNPVKRHDGALNALSRENLVGDPRYLYLVVFVLLFVGSMFILQGASFDRMGRRNSKNWLSVVKENVVDTGWSFVILALAALFLIMGVFMVQWLESIYAVNANQQNRIGNFEFVEALLWMFTFIASGYENDIFPYSEWARFVVVILAIAGLTLPIWGIVRLVNAVGERRLDRDRGLRDPTRQMHHTLICGWNSKGPGLIFTLTCRESPYRGRIVIVAEIDEEFPLKRWHFRRKGRKRHRVWQYFPWWSRVQIQYLRGNPSKRSVLERAYAQNADCAIVLANEGKGASGDQLGVLTALSLRKLRADDEKAFIGVELGSKRDRARYAASKVDQIVEPELISQHMLALACVSEHAVDFILDALSPDSWSEWYSLEVSAIQRLLPKTEQTAAGCTSRLNKIGIAVIGIATDDSIQQADDPIGPTEMYWPEFADRGPLDALIDERSLAKPTASEGYIICAARDLSSFDTNKRKLLKQKVTAIPAESMIDKLNIIPVNGPMKILLIGSGTRAAQLSETLSSHLPNCQVDTCANDTDEPGDHTLTKHIAGTDWTQIVIMSPIGDRESLSTSLAGSADAQTILLADQIKSVLDKFESSARVIAEVHDIENQQLLKDAGVHTVVPISLMAERFLARLVAGRGYVSKMLLAMASLENGIYVRSITLYPGHPLINKTFKDTLMKRYKDGRVLAVLPKKAREEFKNEEGDFENHFVMCPADREIVFQAGDDVIVLTYPER